MEVIDVNINGTLMALVGLQRVALMRLPPPWQPPGAAADANDVAELFEGLGLGQYAAGARDLGYDLPTLRRLSGVAVIGFAALRIAERVRLPAEGIDGIAKLAGFIFAALLAYMLLRVPLAGALWLGVLALRGAQFVRLCRRRAPPPHRMACSSAAPAGAVPRVDATPAAGDLGSCAPSRRTCRRHRRAASRFEASRPRSALSRASSGSAPSSAAAGSAAEDASASSSRLALPSCPCSWVSSSADIFEKLAA